MITKYKLKRATPESVTRLAQYLRLDIEKMNIDQIISLIFSHFERT